MRLHMVVLCSWVSLQEKLGQCSEHTGASYIKAGLGVTVPQEPAQLMFYDFQGVLKTPRSHGHWEGPMRFLIVDQARSFSLSGMSLSLSGSDVRKLIAPHQPISAACVDLLLPCGHLEHKSSAFTGSLGFSHFKQHRLVTDPQYKAD